MEFDLTNELDAKFEDELEHEEVLDRCDPLFVTLWWKKYGFCCGFFTFVGVCKFWDSLWQYAIEDRLVGVMFVYIFLWSNGLQILGWVVLACCLQDAIWLDRVLLMIKAMHVFFCNLPYL